MLLADISTITINGEIYVEFPYHETFYNKCSGYKPQPTPTVRHVHSGPKVDG